MSVILYNIFLLLFRAGVRVASLFNTKARNWLRGRKGLFENLERTIPPGEKIIWVHCASLGEFEQGKPVMELLRSHYPSFRILLTFFSPSGYRAQKDFKGADWVFYLPVDGPYNARRFLDIVHPSLVIFVKYEFWYYYLKKIRYRRIPLLLVSALFRKDMSFFKWYGGLQRKMLGRFDHLFVQNASSKKLMDEMGLADICSVSGDTRFDRVIEIAGQWKAAPVIEQFLGNRRTIIAGSTWQEDEEVLQKALAALGDPSIKLIIAPHEISEKHILFLKGLFPDMVLYSQIRNDRQVPLTGNCLLIDNIGMLSMLYKYASICYVGGGLRPLGVHNVLEAAVYYKPVLFGGYFRKYAEATELVKSGGALPFSDKKRNGKVLGELLKSLLRNQEEYKVRARAAGEFVQTRKGATKKIIEYIQEKRLLTS